MWVFILLAQCLFQHMLGTVQAHVSIHFAEPVPISVHISVQWKHLLCSLGAFLSTFHMYNTQLGPISILTLGIAPVPKFSLLSQSPYCTYFVQPVVSSTGPLISPRTHQSCRWWSCGQLWWSALQGKWPILSCLLARWWPSWFSRPGTAPKVQWPSRWHGPSIREAASCWRGT